MRVTVRCWLYDDRLHLFKGETAVEVPPGTTIPALVGYLDAAFGRAVSDWVYDHRNGVFRVDCLVNGVHPPAGLILSGGDEVTFIPQLAGGSSAGVDQVADSHAVAPHASSRTLPQ